MDVPQTIEVSSFLICRWTTWTSLALIPWSLSVAAVEPVTAPAPDAGGLTLQEVIDQGVLGLNFEPETLLHTKENARKLADLWRKHLPLIEEESWKQSCKRDPSQDDFCPIVLGLSAREAMEAPEDSEVNETPELIIEVVPPSTQVVLDALKAGKVDTLANATSVQMYSALRRIKKISELNGAIGGALALETGFHCKNPIVATAIAQKVETFFPDATLKSTMYSLFDKVASCPDSEAADRARFRSAVHRIADGNCTGALPVLDRLYSSGNGEYAPRALYWKARCADARGDKLQFSMLQQKLLKEFPLSYHSIVLNRSQLTRLSRVLGTHMPRVLLRSHENPRLNAWIRAIEGLIAIDSIPFARRVMARSMDSLLKLEPELMLYLSVLADRVRDPILQFRFLGVVFRQAPDLITQDTLKAFYPLKNFKAIQEYAGSLDPFFVASLIRQESGFNPQARSRVGAMGLMQLMPRTAFTLERVSRSALLDPRTNIRLGTRYIGGLVNHYGNDAELALASYNAGKLVVDAWKNRYAGMDRMAFLDLIPYKETRDYVVLISRNYFWYHNLYGELQGRPLKFNSIQPIAKNKRRMPTVEDEAPQAAPGYRKLVFTLFE